MAFARRTAYITGDVTLDGNLTMGSGKVLTLDAGSLSAPSLRFSNSDSNTGLSATAANVIQVGRSGAASFRLAHASGPQADTTMTCAGQLTCSSSINMTAKVGITAESIKTGDYTASNSDAIVIMNGNNATLTLVGTPGGSQAIWIKNIHATALTVARNGNTIDGAASNISLAQFEFAMLQYEGTGWFRLGG